MHVGDVVWLWDHGGAAETHRPTIGLNENKWVLWHRRGWDNDNSTTIGRRQAETQSR
jgi:hypothetical protein